MLVSKLLRVTFLHTENPQFWKYWYSASSPPVGAFPDGILECPPTSPRQVFPETELLPILPTGSLHPFNCEGIFAKVGWGLCSQ